MVKKELKIRQHKFLDKHTYIGALIFSIGGLLFAQIAGGNVIAAIFAVIFPENKTMMSMGAEIGAIAASFVMLCLFWRHFYPEYEGGLHGGDKVAKWLLIGIGYAVAFCAVTHIANAFITKDPVGFPAAVNCVAAIMAGVYEETIYRGMTASYLMRQWRANKEKKLLPVIVLSSAVFALIHMLNALNGQDLFFTVMQCINAFFMGCLMCALFMRSGSLIPGMIMHALYDFGQFMFVTLINEGGTVADGAFMSTSDIIQLVIMDVVYAALTMYLIRPLVREDIYRIWDMKWKDRPTEVQ